VSESPMVTTSVSRPVMEMMVFPIIKALYYPGGREIHRLIGTGFFIDSDGLFLTARHVLLGRGSAFDLEGATDFAVYCVHSVNLNRKMVARHIDVASVKTHDWTDIAGGRVEMNQFGRGDGSITADELKNTAHLNHLTSTEVSVGTDIFTIAYPRTIVSHSPGNVAVELQSDSFTGRITTVYSQGRDRGMIPWPCYETDMEIMSGASGGPVFVSGAGGVVFGVNCTGTEPHSVSYIVSFAPLIPRLRAAEQTL